MKLKLVLFIALINFIQSGYSQNKLPYLAKKGDATQLMVHNKPFLMRGGELGNSSSSSVAYMNEIWPTLDQMNLNTILAPVYWDLIEPNENDFDFTLVDSLIYQARSHDVKLVLLWFGSWKNSMSCYAPSWVKNNQDRFPRAKSKKGVSVEILTPFSKENLQADLKAFVKLMQHIKAIDKDDNTVIMIQVENEIGMLPDARDYSNKATELFQEEVPKAFIDYLKENKNILMPETLSMWGINNYKSSGTWIEIFGDNQASEELFMAWYFAQFTEQITKAGKEQYNLPMYVNAALNRIGYAPGDYPSAGPLPHLMDVWIAGAPSIDFLSPDIYFSNFAHWCKLYDRGGNPFFIPEARFAPNVDANMFYAFGEHEAMGFSPFSIESTNEPADEGIVKAYALIDQLTSDILKYQGTGSMAGVLLEKQNFSDTIILGGYTLIAKHDLTLGWSDEAKNDEWPHAGALIICTGPGEYIVAGTGIILNFASTNTDKPNVGIESIEEGYYQKGAWFLKRRLNGDQSHQGRHLRIATHKYAIQKLKLYPYK